MALTGRQKKDIKATIKKCLRNKFKNYTPQNNEMPFHVRLLGKDRMALYSFMQSLLTTFGTSIFEPVAATLAKERFVKVGTQVNIGNEIYANCQKEVQKIINQLTIKPNPDKASELQRLQKSLSGSKKN